MSDVYVRDTEKSMSDFVDISLYSYQDLLGICRIPINYLYSCIINN